MREYPSVFRPLISLLAVASCAAACSSGPTTGSPELGVAAQASSASPGEQLCPVTSEYFVLAPLSAGVDPACPRVPGLGGRWKKTKGFTPIDCTPLDPSGSDAALCSYEWSPRDRTPDAPPDLAALLALPGVYVAAMGTTGDPACDGDAALRLATLLSLADVKCDFHGGGNAPKGCDVCNLPVTPGVELDALTVPTGSLHTMAVGMSNGTHQVVSMATPSAGTGAPGSLVSLPLPAPPPGVSYVDGPAHGYGYTTAESP